MKEVLKDSIKNNRQSITIILICLVVAIIIWFWPNKRNDTKSVDLSEYSSIESICELATLKSFYHNVVVFEEEPEGTDKFINDILFWPFGELTRKGYKQFWLEYSGIVETGIDASKVQITGPDTEGVFDIYLPEAKVLNVYADESSLSEPITEKGLFTTITAKEQSKAFSAAQKHMQEEAENDQALLSRAKRNAQLLFKQYYEGYGEATGVDYSVRWIENP